MITFRVSCWACDHRAEFDRLEDARWNAARHKLNGHTVEIKPIGYEIQEGYELQQQNDVVDVIDVEGIIKVGCTREMPENCPLRGKDTTEYISFECVQKFDGEPCIYGACFCKMPKCLVTKERVMIRPINCLMGFPYNVDWKVVKK